MSIFEPQIQPDHPPGLWQLSGPALGHLVVLAPNDLATPRARLAICHSNRIAIGSSKLLSDIQFNHPDFDPVHLKLSISPDHIGSIQVFGTSGVKFYNGSHHYPPVDGQSPPQITLRDGDLFFISQFPFKWEQRWEADHIDWSRFHKDQDACLPPSIPSESHSHQCNSSSPAASASISRVRKSSARFSSSQPTPRPDRIGRTGATPPPVDMVPRSSPPTASNTRSSVPKVFTPDRNAAPRTQEINTPVLQFNVASVDSETPSPPKLDLNSSQSPQQATGCDHHPSPPVNAVATPRAEVGNVVIPNSPNLPCTPLSRGTEGSPRLVITPVNSAADMRFHWERPDPQTEEKVSSNSFSPSAIDTPAHDVFSSPAGGSESSGSLNFDPCKPNVSFRRRSLRRSYDSWSQKRARVTSPDADSSSSDDDNDDLSKRQLDLTPEIALSTPSLTTASLHHHNTPPNPPSPSTTNGTSPSQHSRRKSLLQTILIKQAVEAHWAQQTENTEPCAVSGFSSSDDDGEEHDVEADEVDSAEEEIVPSADLVDDSSDEEQPDSKSNQLKDDKPASSQHSKVPRQGVNLTTLPPDKASSVPSSPEKRATLNSAIGPEGGFSPSLPHHMSGKVHERRLISPSAQLLANYEVERSLDQPLPRPSIGFPLKSSFRRQSYTPEELQVFSACARDSIRVPSPSRPVTLATLRHNTQLNSRSPTLPIQEPRRLRASTPTPSFNRPPSVPSKTVTSLTGSPNTSAPAASHRVIRTPRSFLIKKRGSLAPLGPSVCESDLSNLHLLMGNKASVNAEDDDDDHEVQEGGKRKVTFDQDVFCLEFDQLPEELSASRQKRCKSDDSPKASTDEPAVSEDLMDPRQNIRPRSRRRKSASLPSPSPARPRRHSPRLPALPPVLADSKEHGSLVFHTSAIPSVDIGGLTLSPVCDANQRSPSNPTDHPPEQTVSSTFSAGKVVDCTLESNNSGSNQQPDTLFQNIKSRLFNFGTNNTQTLRHRCSSLPPDLSKVTYPNVKDLLEGLDGLNLLDRDYRSPPQARYTFPTRSHSAPSSSLMASNSVCGRFKMPQVSQFSPRLEGVPNIVIGQTSGGSPMLNSIRAFFGAFRNARPGSVTVDESSSGTVSESSDKEDDELQETPEIKSELDDSKREYDEDSKEGPALCTTTSKSEDTDETGIKLVKTRSKRKVNEKKMGVIREVDSVRSLRPRNYHNTAQSQSQATAPAALPIPRVSGADNSSIISSISDKPTLVVEKNSSPPPSSKPLSPTRKLHPKSKPASIHKNIFAGSVGHQDHDGRKRATANSTTTSSRASSKIVTISPRKTRSTARIGSSCPATVNLLSSSGNCKP